MRIKLAQAAKWWFQELSWDDILWYTLAVILSILVALWIIEVI